MTEWKKGRIKDLIDHLESGISVNGSDADPVFDESAVLKVSAVTYGFFDHQACKPLRNEKELRRAKCNPRAGEIIISRSNTPNLVGASAYVKKDYPNRFLPDKLWQTVQKENVVTNMQWLAYFLSSPSTRFRLTSLATGTSNSMKNITKSELMTLPLLIPPFQEQKAIADLLSTWDEAIEKTERLIQTKEKQFQRLLNDLIYVPTIEGKWKQVTTKSLFKERKETKRDDLPLLSITNGEGVIPREDTNRKDTSNEDKSKYLRICPGDIGYNTMRMWQGVSALSPLEGIVSPAYTICIPGEKLYPSFVAYLFKMPFMIHRFYRYSQGLTSDTWNLKYLHFGEVKMPIPSLEEQKAIAETLSTAQHEIDLLKQLAEKYKTQKRGLMQKILTGEWRVKDEIISKYRET
jgi:type I restriction enzyme S subunit